jgi:23S rRNA (cytidine1920-2'-O)/16S rRNA (cytidine1409-2'-O)-methyltransferase
METSMAAKQEQAGRIRLDQLLVERGFYPSRSRARDAILRGTVRQPGGAQLTRPGMMVGSDLVVEISDPASAYVSRGALKLLAGLDHFGLDPVDARCLDIGASTGGFTQVLLERGAKSVVAIDAGHGQLHPSLNSDPRVTSLEGLNARDIDASIFPEGLPDFIVCDVSFISLKLALPPALELAAPGALGVFLVKPQFEAGKAALGKNGILKDPALGQEIADAMAAWLDRQGWQSIGVVESPVEGGDGNREYLLGGRKTA